MLEANPSQLQASHAVHWEIICHTDLTLSENKSHDTYHQGASEKIFNIKEWIMLE